MPLTICPICNHNGSDEATACPQCAHPLKKVTNNAPISKGSDSTIIWLSIIGGIIFCKIHIITGANLNMPHIIFKDKFSISETFIDIDEITGMPLIAAKSRFPIGFHILQREHLIESDKEMNARIEGEIKCKEKGFFYCRDKY